MQVWIHPYTRAAIRGLGLFGWSLSYRLVGGMPSLAILLELLASIAVALFYVLRVTRLSYWALLSYGTLLPLVMIAGFLAHALGMFPAAVVFVELPVWSGLTAVLCAMFELRRPLPLAERTSAPTNAPANASTENELDPWIEV